MTGKKAKQGDELAGKRYQTITLQEWVREREKADLVHVVVRHPNPGADGE